MTKRQREAGLRRLARGFMVPNIYRTDVWEVSADHGSTYYVDAGVAGIGKDGAVPDNLQDYVESTIDVDAEGNPIATLHRGYWFANLSAPGYLDCTDPCAFPTEREAEEYLVQQYDTD